MSRQRKREKILNQIEFLVDPLSKDDVSLKDKFNFEKEQFETPYYKQV